MKILILSAVIFTTQALLTPEEINNKWSAFKQSQGRRFISSKEDRFRKTLFEKKLQEIEEHNARYDQDLESYRLDINRFADFTEEELRRYTHGLVSSSGPFLLRPENRTRLGFAALGSTTAPVSWNWMDHGILTPVKDQGSCGSCWAFSITGTLEALFKKRTGSSATFSEQQLVDCVFDNDGCGGGDISTAYDYLIRNKGISDDRYYPYEARLLNCRFKVSRPHLPIISYDFTPRADENYLKQHIYNYGPVSAQIDATGGLVSYQKGVYQNPSCSESKPTHAVVIVGYGRENGLDYWLVKNSWGDRWGLSGYFKIARNKQNHCGIATFASYPVF